MTLTRGNSGREYCQRTRAGIRSPYTHSHTHTCARTVLGERESRSQDNNKGTELSRPLERLALKQQNHGFKGKVKHQLAPCVSFKKGPAIAAFSCEFSKLQLLIRLLAFSRISRPCRLRSLQKKEKKTF